MNAVRRKAVMALRDKIEEISNDLGTLRDEEREAFEGLPESLQESEQGQKSSDAADALDEACSELESAVANLDTACE
jgi:hypothetical protein